MAEAFPSIPQALRLTVTVTAALIATGPVGASDAACRQSLAAVSASLQATGALAESVRGDEICGAYRRQFLEVVKARAVAALCTNGADGAQELARLDSAVERINTKIAESC